MSSNWRDNLKNAKLPEEKPHEPKLSPYLGAGKHDVVIEGISLIDGAYPKLRISVKNDKGQSFSRADIFLFDKEGNFSISYKLFVRSLTGSFPAETRRMFMEYLLTDETNLNYLVSLKTVIRLRQQDKGVIVDYRADLKKYVVKKVKDNVEMFDGKEFDSAKDAKAYISAYNMDNPTSAISFSYLECYGFDIPKEEDVNATSLFNDIIKLSQINEEKPQEVVTPPPRVKPTK